tara:strand:+ start:243 stop:785 length:543 start_codon:yes stop_codon:yes gene_type:complete
MVSGGPVMGGKKHMETTWIMGLILALMMTKKKPRRFGQMTLNLGGQALEYLKSNPKGVTRSVRRIEWAHKDHMASQGWTLPPWVLHQTDEDRERFPSAVKVHDVAILHDQDPAVLPLLVHQGSALRGLDALLAEAQEDGALVEDDGKMLVLDMGDGALGISFTRNTKAGKFAPFIVRSHD